MAGVAVRAAQHGGAGSAVGRPGGRPGLQNRWVSVGLPPGPGMAPDGVEPAICREFIDRYSIQTLQVLERLFGFINVEPPGQGTKNIH